MKHKMENKTQLLKTLIMLVSLTIMLAAVIASNVKATLNCDDVVLKLESGATCDGTGFYVYYQNNDLFAPPVNLSISVSPGLTLIEGDNPAYTTQTQYKWKFNCTTAGTYQFNLTVNDTTSNDTCFKTLTVQLSGMVYDPQLSLLMPLSMQVIANIAESFVITINNTGDGDAYNVSGYLDVSNAQLNSTSINVAIINNHSSKQLVYTLTSGVCGSNSLAAHITNYYNEIGELMPSVSNSTSFVVVGSMLEISKFDVWFNNNKLSDGNQIDQFDTITVNVTVKNNGNYYANATVVEIYEDDNLRATINIGNIDAGASKSGTADIKVQHSGNVVIKAIAKSLTACSNSPYDNTASISLNVIAASTTEEEGETGAGGGEGAAAVSENETEEQPKQAEAVSQITTISSSDGLVKLIIYEDTIITYNGKSIDASEIKIEKISQALMPTLPQDKYLLMAYKITPDVEFSKPVKILFDYHDYASMLFDDSQLSIYTYQAGWRELATSVDKANTKAYAYIQHASIFALFTDKIKQEQITGFSIAQFFAKYKWQSIVAIIIIIVILAAILTLLKKKQKKQNRKRTNKKK